MSAEATPMTIPKIRALRGATVWRGSGRRRVRRIFSSMSASMTQLKVLALPAAR